MLQVKALANSAAAFAAASYVVCGVLAVVAPDVYFGIARSWIHGMDLSVLFPTGTTATSGSFVLGLVTLTAVAWVAGASLAVLYNWQVARHRPG